MTFSFMGDTFEHTSTAVYLANGTLTKQSTISTKTVTCDDGLLIAVALPKKIDNSAAACFHISGATFELVNDEDYVDEYNPRVYAITPTGDTVSIGFFD